MVFKTFKEEEIKKLLKEEALKRDEPSQHCSRTVYKKNEYPVVD